MPLASLPAIALSTPSECLPKKMNDLLRESLCKIIEQDPSLHSDAGRCRGTLSDDLRGKYPKEIQLTVAAINYSVPAKLLALKGKPLTQAQLDSFQQELQDKEYLEAAVARWIVESWALALGVISSAQRTTFQQSSSPPAGSNPLKGVSSPPSGTATSVTSTVSPPFTPTTVNQKPIIRKQPSFLLILVVGSALALVGIIGYAVSKKGGTIENTVEVATSTQPSPVSSSTPTQPSKTPKTQRNNPENPDTETAVQKFSPAPLSITEINNAIFKLKAMNPNKILEFPVHKNHNDILQFPVDKNHNYRVIGFYEGANRYFGWNVKTVEDFLEESLQYNGNFSENDRITLIVRNQSTNQRLILKPISKNSPLGHFVRWINSN